ncbi:transcription termination/antitermination NusG family protein [Tardiphaga sp. 709]|uniref:transcription termination/antitermination NusG family protein n=1 Tax=Tardiphaga sp. 709 TaxID=3076039 RepID=UPI0028EF9921|nr:transcription termination/antitermination NusG family protein [Tardiphaga sp. 709]WNV09969.1 transcription termination/antitermination NusG family protein [Tardiphaga sp. 709]
MTWYIAVTNPNCQRRAELELASLGYRAFWPKLRRWVSHARTKKAKEYPVLGRYMFVEIPDGNFYAVRKVNGIEALIADETGRAVAVPPETIWRLKERYLNGEWDFVRRDCKRPVYGLLRGKQIIVDWEENKPMPIGAKIMVVVGEFEDMLATITSRAGKKVHFKLQDSNTYGVESERGVRAA